MCFLKRHSGETLADGDKNTILFAEATSCQLEFKYLAKLTGNKEYYKKVGVFLRMSFKFLDLTDTIHPY